jgi:hypothetical protein
VSGIAQTAKVPQLPELKEFTCKGVNYSVTLQSDKMIIRKALRGKAAVYELPIKHVGAVIVRRHSVVPFAGFTALAAIATVLVRYNALWFLLNLSTVGAAIFGTIALLITVLFAIPTVGFALFVDVAITWSGTPKSFLVRFVPIQQGRSLARRFHGASSGN